jgi:hypothetical protein
MPGYRTVPREFPIVVEALSGGDHVVALARILSRRLEDERVPNALHLYSGDIRHLRKHDVPTTLTDVATLYGEDVLLIVGDGDSLVDPFLGGLRTCAASLDTWRVVVLLTPVPRRRWSWRERRLAEVGIIVLPATPGGLRSLGTFLRSDGPRPAPALERAPVKPGLLATDERRAFRWHRERAPSDAECEIILDAIALELGPNAFELACVLALFPETRPDITMYVAANLSTPGGTRLVDEAGFGALANLPWFRYGRMPDWLRLALARCLEPNRDIEARHMLAMWLNSKRGPEVVQITPESLSDAVSGDASNPDNIQRDAIFLTFARRESLHELDLRVYDEVAKAVVPQARRGRRLAKWQAFWNLREQLSGLVDGILFSNRSPKAARLAVARKLAGLQLRMEAKCNADMSAYHERSTELFLRFNDVNRSRALAASAFKAAELQERRATANGSRGSGAAPESLIRPDLYFTLQAMIVAGDVGFTYFSFELFLLPTILLVPLVLVIGFAGVAIAHACGQAITTGRHGISALLGVAAFIQCAILGATRFAYLLSQSPVVRVDAIAAIAAFGIPLLLIFTSLLLALRVQFPTPIEQARENRSEAERRCELAYARGALAAAAVNEKMGARKARTLEIISAYNRGFHFGWRNEPLEFSVPAIEIPIAVWPPTTIVPTRGGVADGDRTST